MQPPSSSFLLRLRSHPNLIFPSPISPSVSTREDPTYSKSPSLEADEEECFFPRREFRWKNESQIRLDALRTRLALFLKSKLAAEPT